MPSSRHGCSSRHLPLALRSPDGHGRGHHESGRGCWPQLNTPTMATPGGHDWPSSRAVTVRGGDVTTSLSIPPSPHHSTRRTVAAHHSVRGHHRTDRTHGHGHDRGTAQGPGHGHDQRPLPLTGLHGHWPPETPRGHGHYWPAGHGHKHTSGHQDDPAAANGQARPWPLQRPRGRPADGHDRGHWPRLTAGLITRREMHSVAARAATAR